MIRKAPISDLLKKARENSGLSQAEVARELGYTSPQFVSNWERGLSSPPVPKLKKLCKMYELAMDDAYHAMLSATLQEVERKLHTQFYGGKKGSGRKSGHA